MRVMIAKTKLARGIIFVSQSKDEQRELFRIRDYKVVKSNDLIQKSRFQLTPQEQKIVLYLISKIKPNDVTLKEYAFGVGEFCKVCGLNTSGANYKYIKHTIKELSDKSIWIKLENGTETLMRWINKAWINQKSGMIRLRLDDDMKPYLLQLKDRFTQYELFYTLAMKSQYSIRLYEILKSYSNQNKKKFDIEELKKMLFAENYTRFPDFKRKVIDISMREINEFSDMNVTYETVKDGRRYATIIFYTSPKKGLDERLKTWERIDKALDSTQTSLFAK
jgi:plasmid replication initiation protein